MTPEQRSSLANTLADLPATTLLFLKHFRRVEITVRTSAIDHENAWTVDRSSVHRGDTAKAIVNGAGVYRVLLSHDYGESEEFLLAHDGDIQMGAHRGGLDDFSWEGVEFSEVSVAARLVEGLPTQLPPAWRRFHVFLPSGEPCPVNLLVSGAFSTNVSRQEIRIEPEQYNYNRFLLHMAAALTRDSLIPSLFSVGATSHNVLMLFDRGERSGEAEPTAAAQAFHEELQLALGTLPFVPQEEGPSITPLSCLLPPLITDVEMGRDFRKVLPKQLSVDGFTVPDTAFCGAEAARVLLDLGARSIEVSDAPAILASASGERARAYQEAGRGIWIDPMLRILERLWGGLGWSERIQLATSVRTQPLFPISISPSGDVTRVTTEDLECFYPPRSLKGEVPLEGLCFFARDICWGDLSPRDRNAVLQDEMQAWNGLFSVREFKFPDVMRASVLPSLELDRSTPSASQSLHLRDIDRLAAICQLAGRTPNPAAPLPYERLGSNRALFNLSRLDVPCRKYGDDTIVWMPAYRVYFGERWIGDRSIEWVLVAMEVLGLEVPDVYLLLEPSSFAGHLDRYNYLKEAADPQLEENDEDEVDLDEDEETALDTDDRTRWFEYFSWLGINSSLRAVHFHDVEDRAAGWLRTEGLRRPEGWAFKNIPQSDWDRFTEQVREALSLHHSALLHSRTAYFYQLHDLEHLSLFLQNAATDGTAQLGRELYEHLAKNWEILERFARLQVALVQGSPARRTKPPRPYDHELVDACDNFWLQRLQRSWFCPTSHGPKAAPMVWLPTPEAQRRFGKKLVNGTWRYLVPVLDISPSVTGSKARHFAQAIGMREELTPANFTVEDGRALLERLQTLYADLHEAGADARRELRETIRPTYRHLLELFTTRERSRQQIAQEHLAFADAPVLAQSGTGILRFLPAREVFYVEKPETRDRLQAGEDVWTFIIEATPAARLPATQLFGMPVLEQALDWSTVRGELSLTTDGDMGIFRQELRQLSPFLLARLGADRMEERLVRQDAGFLRTLVELVEPVTHITLGCSLNGRPLKVSEDDRLAYVQLRDEGVKTALVV